MRNKCFECVTATKYIALASTLHYFFRSVPFVSRIIAVPFDRASLLDAATLVLAPPQCAPFVCVWSLDGHFFVGQQLPCRLFGLTALNPTAPILSLLRLPGTVTMSRCPKYLSPPTEELRMSTWDPVYQVVKQIPCGRVLSYGALARILRLRGGARSVGRAMAATPSGQGIPWHRVLGEGGKILVREPYASLQKKLLESEGVTTVESKVNLKQHLWTPPGKVTKSARGKTLRKRTPR
jgi:methylated-DNA-protein-cysteine methyltransferase related protein